mmetsp:Transcript_69532/g.137569  ORF Transcript_69532/g.137569 Transcript_69532/m.137569 type:complete len:262 (+) Transcript_69532:1643-2428(+)
MRCGRRGPSSGFQVATIMGLHGCATDRPSRSTRLTPLSIAVSRRLTRSSCRRFTSSMYRMPLCACAKRPGSKTGFPVSMEAWTSNDPTRRSSVQPSGSSTKGQSMTLVWASPFSLQTRRSFVRASHSRGFSGSQLQIEFFTTSMRGRMSRNDLANVVFAVPCPPQIPTPPRLGSMHASRKASFTSSRPTRFEIGITMVRRASISSASAVATAPPTVSARAIHRSRNRCCRLRRCLLAPATKGCNNTPKPSIVPLTARCART